MFSVSLSEPVLAVLRAAARKALARQGSVRVDDVLAALLESEGAAGLRRATGPPESWPDPLPAAEAHSLRVYLDRRVIRFERPAEQLIALGARQVLLGAYEIRHLVVAVAETAATTRSPFARFSLDLPAWRRFSSANP